MKHISIILVALALISPVYAKPTLPYHASASREKQIIDGYKKITVGMTPSEIEAVLDKPDDTTPLYQPKIKYSSQIGTTHWYLIQHLKEHGSVNEVGLIGVAVRTDMKGNVIRVDPFSMP